MLVSRFPRDNANQARPELRLRSSLSLLNTRISKNRSDNRRESLARDDAKQSIYGRGSKLDTLGSISYTGAPKYVNNTDFGVLEYINTDYFGLLGAPRAKYMYAK